MWITTHEGRLVNLALCQTIHIAPIGTDSAAVMTDKNIPIFQGTPAECKCVKSGLHVLLNAVNAVDLKTEDAAILIIAQKNMRV